MSSAADFQLQDVAPGKNEDTAIRLRIGHDLELLAHVMGYPDTFGRVTMKLWDDIAVKVRKIFPTDMAGLRGRTRKDRTIREIRDNGVESERDRFHLPDAQYAHPTAKDTSSLRLVQPVTRKQDRALTTPASTVTGHPPLGASDHICLLAILPEPALRERPTKQTVWRYRTSDWESCFTDNPDQSC